MKTHEIFSTNSKPQVSVPVTQKTTVSQLATAVAAVAVGFIAVPVGLEIIQLLNKKR